MFRKMIAGASALAIGALVATGALASGSGGTTYYQKATGVSIQVLKATSIGVAIDLSLLSVPFLSGNATLMDHNQTHAIGIVQASANTGMSAINQQAASIGVGAILGF